MVQLRKGPCRIGFFPLLLYSHYFCVCVVVVLCFIIFLMQLHSSTITPITNWLCHACGSTDYERPCVQEGQRKAHLGGWLYPACLHWEILDLLNPRPVHQLSPSRNLLPWNFSYMLRENLLMLYGAMCGTIKSLQKRCESNKRVERFHSTAFTRLSEASSH